MSLALGLALAGIALPAQARPCDVPEAPAFAADGATLDLAAYTALTAAVTAYDYARAGYLSCLNEIIFRKVEASAEEVDAARAARSALFPRDPVTGEIVDPVARSYDAITAQFLDGQAQRAVAAAGEAQKAAEENVSVQLQQALTRPQ